MKKIKNSWKILGFLLLLSFSLNFAYDVRFSESWCDGKTPCENDNHALNPYYPSPDLGPFFSTDLNMRSNYKLSIVSGKVPTGVDPTNIKNNDLVCPGTTLQLTPIGQSTYADNHLSIYSVYYADYKDATKKFPLPGPGTRQVGNVRYISKTDYDFLNLFDEGWNEADTQRAYYLLTPFIDEPVIYRGGAWKPSTYFNSQTGAAVACYGNYLANDNGKMIGTKELTGISPMQFTVNVPGSHTIIAEFRNLNCMGANLLYPRQNVPGGEAKYHQTWYYKNNQVTMSTFTPYAINYNFPSSVQINVQQGSGTCEVSNQGLLKDTKKIGTNEYTLVNLKIQNDGTAITLIKEIYDWVDEFEVIPSDDPICMALGGMCQKSAIGEKLSPGESKNVLFYAKRKAPGNGLFVVNTTVDDNGCSDGSCFVYFDLSDSGYSCQINPTTISTDSGNTQNFQASCFENGTKTSCFGDWAAPTGTIVSQDSDSANISFSGSGTLTYTLSNSSCISTVQVTSKDTSKGQCKIIGSDIIYRGATGHYQVKCFDNLNNNVTCDSVDWKGNVDYRERILDNSTIYGAKAGKYMASADAFIAGNKVSCDKNIEVVKSLCVSYT